MKRVAIIGSFQQSRNYTLVQEIITLFLEKGLDVVSPAGTLVVDKRDGFVVFETDDNTLSNEKIQYETLEKIFTANAVYIVNVDGYVGRTTCYEIGRILERKIPLYFMSFPLDLPICITEEFVVEPTAFVDLIYSAEEKTLSLECSCCSKLHLCLGGTDAKA